MFPLTFPMDVLHEAAELGQWVLDPFCGRGTTILASRLMGLPSIGIDSNPVATAVAQAKLLAVAPSSIVELCKAILGSGMNCPDVPEGEFWEWAFHQETLTALCKLRDDLIADCGTPERQALRALLLGALHGPITKTSSSYLSNQSPRTYAPKPNYAVKYWRARNLLPPNVDIVSLVQRRAKRYFEARLPVVNGNVLTADSRSVETFSRFEQKFNIVITSPPYYGMRTYVPDQWLRSWFLGGPSSPDYSIHQQVSHSSLVDFEDDLRSVWLNCESVCVNGAKLVIRFGCISDRKVDPIRLVSESLRTTGWMISEVKSAGTAELGRRQASHFTRNTQAPHEEFDVWAQLR